MTPVTPTSSPRSVAGSIRGLEVFLWMLGLACAIILAIYATQARTTAQAAQAITPHTPAPTAVLDNPVIGRLEIPALKLTVPVLENYDPASLKRGVGHIPGTAGPGGLGNLGLAGHRDTYFRPLRGIRNGMIVNIVTPTGSFAYQVESTEIVTPNQVDVLDIRTHPELTLITCYPFDFIGAAPRRFIVHASLISLDPS